MHESFKIKGNGFKPYLSGTIQVSGAKNAALQALAFSLLFKDKLTLTRVPEIEDIKRMSELLSSLDIPVSHPKGGVYELEIPKTIKTIMPEDLTKRFRASVVLTGPVLARFGKVSFPHPGGCLIGARPIDLFLEAYKKMGAEIRESSSLYEIIAPGGLRGADIFMRGQSVTATQTVMLAAVLAKGKTVIRNAALEPEIEHLAQFLNNCGAKISGAGTPTITIIGTGLLSAHGKSYRTLPDRIEAGSFLILAVLAGRDIKIKGVVPEHIQVLIEILYQITDSHIKVGKSDIRVTNKKRPKIKAIDIKTHEYPGFPTDLQAPMTVLLSLAKGESLVFETIFDGRLSYTAELSRMGASITLCDQHRIIVHGGSELSGRNLHSPDIRAGLALVLAAIVAKGESVIHNVYYIDRGYENIESRLSSIGVKITRVAGKNGRL